MCAMPTASVGAPPAREMMVCLADILGGLVDLLGRDRRSPMSVTAAAALSGGRADLTAPGLFMVK